MPLELTAFLSVSYVVSRVRPRHVEPLDAVPSTASFPSGHVAAAIALYLSVALIVRSLSVSDRTNRWVVIGALVLAAGIGFSRVYRGLHYPTDVLAGAVLGFAVVFAAAIAARLIDVEDT